MNARIEPGSRHRGESRAKKIAHRDESTTRITVARARKRTRNRNLCHSNAKRASLDRTRGESDAARRRKTTSDRKGKRGRGTARNEKPVLRVRDHNLDGQEHHNVVHSNDHPDHLIGGELTLNKELTDRAVL